MIDQLTVFLENSEGRLSALTRVLADAGINMNMLTIAEVADYGLVRIICNDPDAAVQKLDVQGFRASKTRVLAVAVPNEPGGLAGLLEAIAQTDANIEYGYCFNISDGRAVDVLKVDDADAAASAIQAAGFTLLEHADLF